MMTVCQPAVADPDWLIPPDVLATTAPPIGGALSHANSLTTQLIRSPSFIQLSIIRT